MNVFGRRALQIPLVLWTLFSLVPFVLIALFSLRDNTGLSEHPFGIGGAYYPGNFLQAWHGPVGSAGMSAFLFNSVEAAAAAVVVNLAIGSAAAYFTTGLRRASQVRLMRVFLVGTVVPVVLLIIPYYREYQALDLLSSPVALGIAYGVQGLPTTILVLHSFFQDFPGELREAAAVDGLGPLQTYFRIVLPLSKGPVATAGLLQLIWVWNETQLAIVLLQDPHSLTTPVGLLGFQQIYLTQYGPIFAGLSLALIPVLVLYLAFHRTITKGVSLSGVSR
jgi:ABC-type glycerol-3-phosphate transport system permease component